MTVTLLRGNALQLPLADDSVDLIVTSPPYFGLRQYTDGGRTLAGQIGTEATPAEFLDALIAATREMRRVLKPSGSIFVNLGDKYAERAGPPRPGFIDDDAIVSRPADRPARGRRGNTPVKSLMLIPERYRIRCVDELGLIVRAVVVWSKPNGLPESVTDRARRSHEDWVHLTKAPRYYAATDEIREDQATARERHVGRSGWKDGHPSKERAGITERALNPLGKLPGSVWSVPTQPLNMPAHIAHAVCCAGAPRPDCQGDDHFAAFPMEWPRRLILGWSPPGICTACGEGRRPVTTYTGERGREPGGGGTYRAMRDVGARDTNLAAAALRPRVVTGYVCACTPYTDHPDRRRPTATPREDLRMVVPATGQQHAWPERVGPVREYHFDQWTPAPTRPAVVLDPFGGTGTTALLADVLGRHGVHVDLSRGYLAGARWRTTDPGERAKAMQVRKPPPPPPGINRGDDLLALLDDDGVSV